MDRRVVSAGLFGGVAGILWTVLSMGLVPVRDSMGWKEVPNEEVVLQALDANLTETGLYLVPGHSPPDSLFRAQACRHGSPSFGMRVAVVASFGVFLALTANIQLWGMELYPLTYSLLMSVNGILTWLVIGFVMAWRVRPDLAEPKT
jgi:hypothetical protein